ncbi:MAG: hypothetical protein MZV63_64800 [Marinilabiliales bacterium]|nr:hypothetical protein [Marinilabiliales bacterium]
MRDIIAWEHARHASPASPLGDRGHYVPGVQPRVWCILPGHENGVPAGHPRLCGRPLGRGRLGLRRGARRPGVLLPGLAAARAPAGVAFSLCAVLDRGRVAPRLDRRSLPDRRERGLDRRRPGRGHSPRPRRPRPAHPGRRRA